MTFVKSVDEDFETLARVKCSCTEDEDDACEIANSGSKVIGDVNVESTVGGGK